MRILVTGSAGFIGFHLCKRLIEEGFELVGLDNVNSYYDTKLKEARLSQLYNIPSKNKISLIKEDILHFGNLQKIFEDFKPDVVVNLAAQAGVRNSIINPSDYIQSNLVGFANILECCRHNNVKHLVYASSSSVYGGNTNFPFSESDSVDHPVSLYAATKKSNELMAHSYSHLFGLPSTGLRFFTVYGPWGRPDMALFLFTKAILNKKPIRIFNHGKMIRDFTYIDDIINSIIKVIDKPPSLEKDFDTKNPNPSKSWAPYRIFNIGNSQPVSLMNYIKEVENSIGIEAEKLFLPIQPGDVPHTSSDCSELESWIGFKPKTSVQEGVKKFVEWYRFFYEI
tara:strand:- start:50812 stop:51828 length:1017 start_codon:yes stop_codon:yes gene_type:complete